MPARFLFQHYFPVIWELSFGREVTWLQPSAVRILVVHESQPWRHMVSSELLKKPGLQVVGEASDGLEAVRKVED